MNKFIDRLQEFLLPIATKISNQRFLVALRDSFMGIMPVIMPGSFALLLNAFLVDLPDQFGMTGITTALQPLVDINYLVFKGSVPICAILFVYCLGNNVAKIYKTDGLSAGLVALASFIISIGNSVKQTVALPKGHGLEKAFEDVGNVLVDGDNLIVTVKNVLPGGHINAGGYFTAILIGFLASVIFCKLMNKNFTIKMPDSVPPAIARPFTSILPGLVAMYVTAILSYIITATTGEILLDLVYKLLQIPLIGLSQNFFSVVIIAFLTQLLWFFGIHGGNVMAPVMEVTFGVAMLANLEAYQKGEAIPYLWNSGSYGAFVWYATLGLLIAIFIGSRNHHYRQVAKLGVMPVLFNIGEPVMYGLPTVLNPILFIPFVLCPIVLTSIAYLATSWGLVSPVTQNVTWVMPPVLYGFFSTGFDWRAIVLSLVNLAAATIIYWPFVKMADKEALREQETQA